ncbi:hypothetical protein ACFP1Z_09285 [Streptomyces gamaensis]|uniref:DNA-binding phage zinc finger domain-containing protein n=1 Tax=Streptomyces gamaensis TaxID=1763542 RepID=A0ABW0YY67_9ACTN
MDRQHVAALLNFCATVDSRVRRSMATQEQAAATIRSWAEALAHVPAVADTVDWDASRAARRYYEQAHGDRSAQFRPIEPADLLAAWAPYRAELMNRHTDPLPTADPDDVVAWRAELLGTRHAVAHGQQPPSEHRALTAGGPHPDVEARLRAIGSCIPAAARAELARYRPTRAAREAAVAAGQPDPLGVRCDWCQAPAGQPCRSRRTRPDGSVRSNAHRARPHPSRVDLAAARLATAV